MYCLQHGILTPSKQEYSYGRRAQSVTYLTKWKQLFLCEEKQPLIDWVLTNDPKHANDYRIEGMGKNAIEGITLIEPPQASR